MAPKKDKKSEPDENQWETIIVEAPLDDDNWKVKVVLIETVGGEQERMYLNKFEIFAAEEKRFVIKNICKTETIFMINQLGGDKKIKDPNLKVFEECQSYLADKKDIPPDVLALVIKHLILKMKDEYLFISQQRLEVRQGMQRESATMVNKAEVRGTVGSATQDEPPPPPPPPVKGKGKGDGEPASVVESSEGKKFNTQLRVRGEEWRDKVYVDDYPIDGPNLYVAVTGFMEPNLPGSLVKVGIPLTAVVQIKIDPTQIKVPSGLMKATKRGQSLTELLVEKSLKFWDDIQQLRIDENSADDFKDTAFIVFSPPYWNSDDLSGSPEKIYDELCFLMYDIQDLSRQHLHYKDNMSIMDVPEDVCNQHFNKLYDQNIDDLPLECVTIYSVLDSILRIACTSGEEEGEISETSVQSAEPSVIVKNTVEEKKMEISENLVKQIFNTLCNTEAGKKKYRLTYGQEYEDNREPIVIHYGDLAKYNTFHLGNINLDNIVLTSLLGMPINNLWRTQPRPCGELEAKINFHVNVLLSCLERSDVETAELNRLLNILACRKLYNNRSSLKKLHLSPTTISEFKKKYLKRSVLAEPLPQCPSFAASGILSSSFPSMTRSDNDYECAFSQPNLDPESQRLNFLFDCPDISQLVTAAEIENNKPLSYNLIDDFDYFEDLSGNCAHQILRDAFNKFNCVDYKYCEVTDSFILMCFNSHDNEGIAREEWRSHLTTPLCLQDFFDFILDEEYDWIQNEEKIYDENLLMEARSVSKDVVDPHALKSCVETTDVEMDLLMEGSLKYEEYVQVEEAVTETTDISGSVTTKLPMSVDVDSKSTKKKAASARKPTKFHKESEITNIEVESLEIPAKPFLGYDLGDRRVEVFGKDAIFFSRDGTKITSMYTLTIPINLEYINLNILPGNGNNEFWMHKALGDHVTQEIRDTCESFRITSKDQVLIYVKKQMYKVSLPSSSTPDVHTARSVHKTNALDEDGSKIEETKYFHSLYVSWPNGMITETVYQDNSPKLSHIKQYHTRPMPHLDEEMRCISLNGEVIIFKPSNDIEVFKPDGTYIKINKYYKRAVPIIAQEPEVEPREDTAKKAKKSKSKGSSKIVEPVEEIVELPPAEYEVIVNEFEIIEPNGLRQQWVDEDPIDLEKLLIKTATDYCLGEVFSRRMDGTNILLNKDGLQCVTFPDRTRIVTSYVVDDLEIYPEWTDEEIEFYLLYEPDTIEGPISKSSVSQKSNLSSTSASKKMEEEEVVKANERTDGYVFIHILYTVEHPNFSTVSINNVNGTISVESPNETVVTVDKDNNYEMNLDNETSASFDGENLLISYEACSECRAFTNCDIKIMSNEESSLNAEKIWLKMTDSFNTQIIVDDEGAISLSDEPNILDPLHAETVSEVEYGAKHNSEAEDKDPDIKSESSLVSHGKCREMYLAKNVRFFVVRRYLFNLFSDFNCAELLHRALVEEYKRACRWQPWCSINQFDTFGDHRNLVSILTPIHLTETEKWLMESKQANKPKFLTYKDLKKDDGKGFYHWMRPYERFVPQPLKPDNVLPERLPRAYILRILEREWDDEKRKELKGARELIQAVLRYRCIMEADRETIVNIPLIDMRNDEERRVDDVIQALAHRIYEDLKGRVADDIQSRAKLTITTSPLVLPEEVSVEGEYEEETDEAKSLEERRESLVEEAEAAEKISPALQRYWRRRAEEFKEEQFYKYLLREGSVPPYFRNVLGGAIWWEVNNATAEAVTLSERRNMKCVCADHEATSSGSAPTSKRYM